MDKRPLCPFLFLDSQNVQSYFKDISIISLEVNISVYTYAYVMKMNIHDLHTSAYCIITFCLAPTYHFCICLALLHFFHEYLNGIKMLKDGQNIERTFYLFLFPQLM